MYSLGCYSTPEYLTCITICLAVPASGRSFRQSTKIWRRPHASKGVPAADACTAPTTPGSLGALPSRSPSRAAPTELLLRSRRLPQASHTAVGAVPRPKGLPQRHGHLDQRHAARTVTAPGPRAFRTLRRRPADHRSLAGLLARALSSDSVLEAGPRSSGVGGQRSPPFPSRSWTPSSPAVADAEDWELLLRFLAPITLPGGLRIAVAR